MSEVMSARSLPVARSLDQENVRKSASEVGVKSPVETRRSARVKQATQRFEFESYRAERAKTLFNSRTGYIGALTRLQRTIQQLMDAGGSMEDLESKQK